MLMNIACLAVGAIAAAAVATVKPEMFLRLKTWVAGKFHLS
jgi:hypothetical protein